MNFLISLVVFILVTGVFLMVIRAALGAFYDPPLNRKWMNLIQALLVLLFVLIFLSYLGLIPSAGWSGNHRWC